MPPSNIRLCDDEDVINFEPNIEQIWPRRDEDGNGKNDWNVQRKAATREIEAYFEGKKDTAERFELGRVSERDLERLRDPCAWLLLHFIYVAADTQGDAEGFFRAKATHYWQRAIGRLDSISIRMDYDVDNSGNTDDIEKDQPFTPRFIRG